MDEVITYLGLQQRQHPGMVPLLAAGWPPGRRRTTTRTCGSCNIQFIVRGKGWLELADQRYDLVAPCVFLRPAGAKVAYGPHGTWDELFLAYAAQHQRDLQQRGLWDDEQPMWYIEDGPGMAREIRGLVTSLHGQASIDLIDRQAEVLWLRAIHWRTTGLMPSEDPVTDLARVAEALYPAEPSLAEVAQRSGITCRGLTSSLVTQEGHFFSPLA